MPMPVTEKRDKEPIISYHESIKRMERLTYGTKSSPICPSNPNQICPRMMRFNRNVHLIIASMSIFLFLFLLNSETDDIVSTSSKEAQSHVLSHNGSYKGTPWKNDRTVSVKTVAETKFARCDVHTVLSEDGKGSTVNDWIFMEEMDAVNVIVSTIDKKFLVFKQGKYAIPGATLSPVGGFIDKGESPFVSARREVMEELGMGSHQTLEEMRKVREESGETTTDDINKEAFSQIPNRERTVDSFGLAQGDTSDDEQDWVFLGRYRTAANRGGGFIYTYLLKNAVPIRNNGGTADFQMSGDDEAQEINLLTFEEMQSHLMKGHFQEVKWAATIALALLHLQNEQ